MLKPIFDLKLRRLHINNDLIACYCDFNHRIFELAYFIKSKKLNIIYRSSICTKFKCNFSGLCSDCSYNCIQI